MILIAESKTMSSLQSEISGDEFRANRPLFDGIANSIMYSLREDSLKQLSAQVGISMKLAVALQRMIYEFPNKSLGMHAIRAFTGVVFRQLRLSDYDDRQLRFLSENVRIISSLYGWLRPFDIIKQYRFEFKSRVAPNDEPLMKYWKRDMTIALVKDLQERGDNEIIDLLPSDASKCIDWKLVKRFAKVYKVDFKTIIGPDKMKTPNSGRLKELRGCLLNLIISHGVSSAAGIAALESSDFMSDPAGSAYPSSLSFITA